MIVIDVLIRQDRVLQMLPINISEKSSFVAFTPAAAPAVELDVGALLIGVIAI
jgi:hypothetical protein